MEAVPISTYIKWSRFDISFYNLNVLSESPLTMTSRHECKLFNWYHYTSHRFDGVALALQGWHRQTSGDLIWKIHFAFLFQKKMNNFKWHKKRAKVQFRRRTKTKRVAWSGPHATWRFNEARIVWHAVVLVLFSTICNLFFWFVKTIVDRGLSFTVSIDCSNSFYMNFRGRYWCGADLLLSLLRQGCQPWVAEGSHLRSSCRQWKVHRETKQS